MYIDDFEDFYRADESEFPEDFYNRNDFDEDDDFEEFEEFTDFEDLDDFRDDDTFRGIDDTYENDELDEFDELDEPDYNSFKCPGGCPFYRQFYRQFPFPPGPGGPGGPGRPGRPGGPGQGQGQGNRPPSGPPPSGTPQEPLSASGGPQTFAVDAGSIRGCRFRYAYIWPRRGRGFWMWITFVGRRSVSGWRWDGRRWFYFGMDLRDIRSFRCY